MGWKTKSAQISSATSLRIVFQAEFTEQRQLLLGPYPTDRVVGTAQNHHLHTLRKFLPQMIIVHPVIPSFLNQRAFNKPAGRYFVTTWKNGLYTGLIKI